MKKVKESGEDDVMNKTLFLEELEDLKSNVAERWRRLKGMPPEEAVVCVFSVFGIIHLVRFVTRV